MYEAFNTSGGLGSLAETYGKQCEQINYKTMRYPGHCAQMRLLMNDLKLNSDRATLKRVLEHAVPQTLQDVVIVYAAVAGKQDGELREENYVNKVYPQVIAGRLWSAIQVTTAAGITAVVDLVLSSPRKLQGLRRAGAVQPAGNSRQSIRPVLRARRHQGRFLRRGGQGSGRPSAPAAAAGKPRGQAASRGERNERRSRKSWPTSPASSSDSASTRSMPAPGAARSAGPRTSPAALITSSNPATGETLAQVRGATVTDYEARDAQRRRGRRRLARGARAAPR